MSAAAWPLSLLPPRAVAWSLLATASALAAAALLLSRRKLATRAKQPRVIATYRTKVTDRRWYRQVVVTEHDRPASSLDTLRSLHLGSPDNVPESTIRLRRASPDEEWKPVACALLKPHLQHSLLAFCFLPSEGLPTGRRAALIGCAAGAMLHFWRECVPGGDSLCVDAVELDGAVLDAAREHLGLRACEVGGAAPPREASGACGGGLAEPSPGVRFHVADGTDFLRDAEDEEFTLLMVDLDVGTLGGEQRGGAEGGGARGGASGAAQADVATSTNAATAGAPAAARRPNKRLPPAPDPTRDMYRVLASDGVLVINEYSEEPSPAVRLESLLRLVRLLRRFFPEVHVLRTNTNHNTMLIAPVAPSQGTRDLSALAELAARCCAHLGRGGIDLRALVSTIPPNRYQVYA